jgi:RNA polymerase sigma-70 factor (sigma-E family)
MDEADEELFREFVALHSPELMRRAFVLVGGDFDAAKDLVQAALIKLVSRWTSVEDPLAYLRTVIYRQQISWWRRGWSRFEVTSGAVPDRAGGDGTHVTDLRVIVRAAMRRLTPKQRAVLFLRYFEDLPEADVASVLGCSVGTVRSTNHRALARLRAIAPELGELDGDRAARHDTPAMKEAL